MIVLGLGSNAYTDQNRDARMDYLRRAVSAIDARCARVHSVSPLYESDALLLPGSPESWNHPFLNLALLCQSALEPTALLAILKDIECDLGRQQRERWAPREIDIDILAWEGREIQNDSLCIPHPGLLDRPFALLPLADVAPTWRFNGHTAAELALPWRFAEGIPLATRRSLRTHTQIMGVVNVTPDSFSDGGLHASAELACARVHELETAGASVVDIGAESTRPDAPPLAPGEEWARLKPVLSALAAQPPRVAELSIDTRHAETATRALDLLKTAFEPERLWLNDVTGFSNADVLAVAARSGARLCVMHSLGIPPSKNQTLDPQCDPVEQILDWGKRMIAVCERAGVARARIVIDPGIGFGKTWAQSFALLEGTTRLRDLGVPLLIGHSRKSFLSVVTAEPASGRDPESAAISLMLARRGIDFLRVHDVPLTRRTLTAGLRMEARLEWR